MSLLVAGQIKKAELQLVFTGRNIKLLNNTKYKGALILVIRIDLTLGDFSFELRTAESVLLGQATQRVDALNDLWLS